MEKIYTIVEKSTGRLKGASVYNEVSEEEIAIEESLTFPMVKPYFNFETREFYEGATQEDIALANKKEVPFEVALWRVRVIIKMMGLEEMIESALEQLPEPTKTGAKYAWQFGTTIERQSQTVLFLQQGLGMKNEQLDEMFIQANDILI